MIKMVSNLDSTGDISGTITGTHLISKNADYMSELIEDAHEVATRAFDEFAASYGLAGGIQHMFEYGTPGITPGPTMFQPTDRMSQLWTHFLDGVGNNRAVTFLFRPAVVPNPQPTPESTGVEAKYLKHLSGRKYVFRQRAAVTELGTTVNIKAKNGDFLFVPFRGRPPQGKYANNRGYMMWNSTRFGSIKSTPGATTAGNFSFLWHSWWNETGGPMMEHTIFTNYNSDLAEALKRSAEAAIKVPPAPVDRFKALKTSATKRTTSLFMARAKKRGGRHKA